MMSHFPILQVVLPLIAAPLMILFRRGAIAWLIAVVVSAAALVIAATLFVQTANGEVISYAIGSWPPPWGIEYRIDAANAFVLVLVSGMGLVVSLYNQPEVWPAFGYEGESASKGGYIARGFGDIAWL